MKPVDEMVSIRESIAKVDNLVSKAEVEFGQAVEIIIKANFKEAVGLKLEGRDGGVMVWPRWNLEERKVIVDRRNGDIRQVEWEASYSSSWRIFLVLSSLELFWGFGDIVFSSRVYPIGGWKLSNLSNRSVLIKAQFKKKFRHISDGLNKVCQNWNE